MIKKEKLMNNKTRENINSKKRKWKYNKNNKTESET